MLINHFLDYQDTVHEVQNDEQNGQNQNCTCIIWHYQKGTVWDQLKFLELCQSIIQVKCVKISSWIEYLDFLL